MYWPADNQLVSNVASKDKKELPTPGLIGPIILLLHYSIQSLSIRTFCIWHSSIRPFQFDLSNSNHLKASIFFLFSLSQSQRQQNKINSSVVFPLRIFSRRK